MLKLLLNADRIRGATIANALRRKTYWTFLRVPCVHKGHTCRRLGRGTCTTTNTKKVCFPSFDRRRCQGENCGKGTHDKRTTGGQRENSFSAPEKDKDGKKNSPEKLQKSAKLKKLHSHRK